MSSAICVPPPRSGLTSEAGNRCKTGPLDKRKTTLKGALILSRECRYTYYTPPRAEFQLCKKTLLQYFFPRSEEHTSELQSRSDLVCRLLLEKKKKRKEHNTH